MLLVGQRFLMLCSNNRERGPPDQICSDYTHNSILNNMSFSSCFKIQPPVFYFVVLCWGPALWSPPHESEEETCCIEKPLSASKQQKLLQSRAVDKQSLGRFTHTHSLSTTLFSFYPFFFFFISFLRFHSCCHLV